MNEQIGRVAAESTNGAGSKFGIGCAFAPDTAGINPAARGARGAFTLVEMLVSVALVVIMMTLFATIFQIATNAMATQKGIAENDQRVRLVLTRLRNDLNGFKSFGNDQNPPYRTFRNLVPFGPDENTQPNFNTTDRTGYFYISENNPDDDTDDVLALTVQFPPTSLDQFYGKAAVLLPNLTAAAQSYGPGNPNPGAGYPPPGNATVPIANPPAAGTSYWPNQPDFDDITGYPNGIGNSQFAEVCYFLRKGTLYRRVLMIRDPAQITPKPNDGTPTDVYQGVGGNRLDLGIYALGTRDFWNDFDYSAYFDSRATPNQLKFHGTGTVVDSFAILGATSNPFCLGNPAYRFGFDCTYTGGAPATTYGLPIEYVSPAANQSYFIGRFTHGETSDLAFRYPGSTTGPAGNPMSGGTTLAYNNTTGQVGYGAGPTYFAGPRMGEDILMTNVLKFDIKVFDPAASFGPDGAPGVAGVDDDGDKNFDVLPNGKPDTKELGWPGSDDGDFVDIGHMGLTGFYNATTATAQRTAGPMNVPITMYYKLPNPATPAGLATARTTPSMQYTYPNPNWANAGSNINRYDTWNPTLDLDNDLPNHVNDCPPFRPFNFGADGRPGVKGVNDDGNAYTDWVTDANGNITGPDLAEIGWPGSDDQPVPLSAIQIKITFFDPTSNQIREVTLVQSLLYTP